MERAGGIGKWWAKLLFSLNGRKLIVVLLATVLILAGVIGEDTWRWVAAAAVCAVGAEKVVGLWQGRQQDKGQEP